jgi:DnaJ homologue, subfamily C, member 28, conserved domain
MFTGFEKIVEERILRAQKGGSFDDLPGAGKPLDFSDDRFVPEDLRLAYKILKNADCTPPEIELKKEIVQTESLLAGMEDTVESFRLLKKLNFLIMKFNMLRGGSFSLEMPQQYRAKLADHFGANARHSGR